MHVWWDPEEWLAEAGLMLFGFVVYIMGCMGLRSTPTTCDFVSFMCMLEKLDLVTNLSRGILVSYEDQHMPFLSWKMNVPNSIAQMPELSQHKFFLKWQYLHLFLCLHPVHAEVRWL